MDCAGKIENENKFTESNGKQIDDWTFHNANTRRLTHCYHDYPARMIPQIAAKLLDMFGKNANILFDPYCGTGTSLFEAILRGKNAIGTDLNPLACLIAEAKTSIPDLNKLNARVSDYQRFIYNSHPITFSSIPEIKGIKNLEFQHIDTFKRSIPNKRMASLNSPSNIPGEVDNTMVKEFIIVMRKI